jgi:hypothetical protein
MMRSVSLHNVSLETGGSATGAGRFVFITPCPTAKTFFSGASTYTTYTSANDDNLAITTAGYKHLRAVAMCVRISKNTGFETPNGNVMVGCFPIDTSSSFTPPATQAAARSLLLQNGGQAIDISEGAELIWCPRSQDDFVPFVPTSTYTTDSNIDGFRLTQIPTLNIYIDNAATTTSIQLTITTVYQGFLLPAQAPRGAIVGVQNQTAMDQFMSASRQVCLLKRGSLADSAASYAARIAGVVAGSGWESLANGVLSKIRC